MDVIFVAEKWGVPPWEVAGDPVNQNTRQTWYRRARLYYQQMMAKQISDAARLTNGGQ